MINVLYPVPAPAVNTFYVYSGQRYVGVVTKLTGDGWVTHDGRVYPSREAVADSLR